MEFTKNRKIIAVVLAGIIIAGLLGYIYLSEETQTNGWDEPVQITEDIKVSQVHFSSDGILVFPANGSVFKVNADGTNLRTLFSYEGVRRIALTPDGKKIVLDNDFDIFIANIDGSDLKPLADDPNIFEFASSVSPDGKEIVFVTIDDMNSIYGIWTMNLDGTDKRNILITSESVLRHSRWSPDGTRISYFSVSKGESVIWIMNRDGSDKTNLTSDVDLARQASWSNDGKKIVFSSRKSGDYDIWTMNSDGSNKVQITSIPGSEAKPVWSPDDKKIAFVCSDCFNSTGSDLYILSRK